MSFLGGTMKVEKIVGKDALLSFDEYTIGYVVRYLLNPYINVNPMMSARDNGLFRAISQTATGLPTSYQHADCILSSGEPICFVGGRQDGVLVEMLGYANGHILEYKMMKRVLNELVDMGLAEESILISKLLIIQVPQKDLSKVRKFHSYWEKARTSKTLKRWERFTNNCSTIAHNAFIEAELLPPKDVNEFDTPDRVYERLVKLLPKDCQLSRYGGYLGFLERPNYRNQYYLAVNGNYPAAVSGLL